MHEKHNSTYAHYDILDGDAKVYKRHDSKYWHFRMWLPKENKYYKKSLRTKDKETALSEGRNLALTLMTEEKLGKKRFGITYEKLVELYLEHREQDIDKQTGITKGRHKTIRSQLKYSVNILGAKTRMGALDNEALYDYSLLRKKSHLAEYHTTRNESITINAMMQWGYDKGHVHFPKFVFKKIKIKNDDIGKRDTFTDEEYASLCRFMRTWVLEKNCMTYKKFMCKKTGRWTKGTTLSFDKELQLERQMVRDYISISANTGLRVGEIRQLLFSDIEKVEEHMIDDEIKLLAKIKVRWETSKVRKNREFLARGGEYFIRLKDRQLNTEPHHLVFSMDGKRTLTSVRWSKHWKELMQGIGINDWKKEYLKDENGEYLLDEDENGICEGRNITFYSLRHYCISSRVKSSVPIIDIAKQMGTSFHHIESTYLHYEEEQSRTAALKSYKKIDGIINSSDGLSRKKHQSEYGVHEVRLSSQYVH